jgi:lambda family phage portal protein
MNPRLRAITAPAPQDFAIKAYTDTAHSGASLARKQLSNWVPERTTADVDLLPDLGMLVARSRDLNRNNGVAAGAFQTVQDNVVGAGLRLASNPNYRALGKDIKWAEEWTRNVETLWQAYAESTACDAAWTLNFASMTNLIWRSVLENGEALALPLWLERSNMETPYRTCFQILDTDRLSNPWGQMPTLNFRGGIEMDDFGRPVAYHVRKQLPFFGWYNAVFMGGGGIFGDVGVGGSFQWERVPAMTDFGRPRVLHLYQKDRADQTRGKPILSPVIEQFRMLDSYQRTELQSAIVNSLVAGVIETPMDPSAITEMMGGDPKSYLSNKNEYRVHLEGGAFIPLWPGDKLTPYTPMRPPQTYEAFITSIIRQIGDAMGLPYELIAKDFSKVTYASARAALGEAWRFFFNRRKWLSEYWATPVYSMWLEEAVSMGQVEAPDFYENKAAYTRCKWIGPPRSQIDPVKEAQASALRLQNRTTTLENECAESGLDWNEVLEQIALENARMDELHLLPEPQGPDKPPKPNRGLTPADTAQPQDATQEEDQAA